MEEPRFMHPGEGTSSLYQFLEQADDDRPQDTYVSAGKSIDVCSPPAQHSSEEQSSPSDYTADSSQTHQLADDVSLPFGLSTLFPPEIRSSPCTQPSQDISGRDQSFRQLDDDMPRSIYLFGKSIDVCSPAQRASKEPSIHGQDIAHSSQIHQLANEVSPKSRSAKTVHAEMMDIPGHASERVHLDQNLKDIDAKSSSIAFSPEIMQAGGEETEEEIAAVPGSSHHDPSMPSIDDKL